MTYDEWERGLEKELRVHVLEVERDIVRDAMR